MEPWTTGVTRRVYVISDLHLGGRAASATDRGFQMMTHPEVLAAFVRRLAHERRGPIELVIAGDFVDFLAEEAEPAGTWTPLVAEQAHAVRVFRTMATEPGRGLQAVLAALGELLAAGHQLTLLLGNHDIELSYPAVRRELARAVGARPGHGFQFIFDGEAYQVGNALIEHGNRYDPFNVVDHDKLRRRRSLQSRGQEGLRSDGFTAPAGSRLVAEVMNPIKSRYAFVDLLKPETTTVLPILLALEPALAWQIRKLLPTMASAATHTTLPGKPDIPLRLSDAAANAAGVLFAPDFAAGSADPLAVSLGEAFGSLDEARGFLATLLGTEGEAALAIAIAPASAAGRGAGSELGYPMPAGGRADPIESRLPALHRALRTLQNDDSFRLDKETTPAYLNAARKLCERGNLRYVIFGHSHLAREVDLGNGCKYLNTGTWANLLRIPPAVVSEGPQARAALAAWVADLRANRLDIWFRPTYARLDLNAEDCVLAAQTLEVTPSGLAPP